MRDGSNGKLRYAAIVTENPYSVIIMDYYQNVTSSMEMPELGQYEVQEKLAFFLDTFMLRCSAPILVLAQLKEGKDLSFKEAMEGRKVLYNKASCVMELRKESEHSRTAWKIHKSRFNEANGATIHTGFERGRFVRYTPEFRNKAELSRQRIAQSKLFKNIFNKGDDNGEIK